MGKEIKLKHKAPVVSIFVVDKNGMPLVGEVEDDKEKGRKSVPADNVCTIINLL